MKIKCDYCDKEIDDSLEKCPNCGAPNKNYKRVGNRVPTTIEELKQWYADHNLPSSNVTRFFIGEDYKEPKAFGIYKDDKTGNFVVYKNKDTGVRKIRYEGKDEKYAVNELYLRLKEEIFNQKSRNHSRGRKMSKVDKIVTFLSIGFLAVMVIISLLAPDRGYYNINNKEYYYVHGNWFVYTNNDWEKTRKPNYSGDLDTYFDGEDYSSSSDYTDIKDSSVYEDEWDSSDWDSDSSWDSGDSWDSGGTDWGSDW